MEDPPVFVSLGPAGSSHYSKSIPITTWMIQAATPTILKAIADIPYSSAIPFTICDYGTADGVGSISLFNACIDTVRSVHGKQTEILIIYNDLPTNDFISTMKNAIVADNVYTTMVAKSFYNQISPSGTVHLGICVAGAHWLSSRPCNSNGPLVHLLDNEIVTCYREQAVKDWETFLLHRTKELVPGGHLMTSVVVDDLDGSQPMCPLWAAMNQVWRDLWQDKRIKKDEYMGTSSGIFHSTTADKLAPFDDLESAVSRAGLRLINAEHKNTTTGFQHFGAESEKDYGSDHQALGKGVARTVLGVFHAAYENALSSSRQRTDIDAIMSEVRQRLADIVTQSPDIYSNMECRAAYILMKHV